MSSVSLFFRKYFVRRRSLTALTLSAALLGPALTACRKPRSPSPAIQAAYQANADLLCRATVSCIKKEIGERLKSKPERRDMILRRMTLDLCRKNQYALIGKLSVHPERAGGPASAAKELYETYGACARAVASAPDCAERKKTHRTHSSCAKLRGLYGAK